MVEDRWTRRDFVRTVGLGAAAVAGPALPGAGAPKKGRPNLLVIIADDLGYSDLGCYGSEIATPNIDSLAARGLRFTQFYGCTVCCPSRAALMTGLYPHQAGMGWYVRNGADSRPPGPYQGYLGDDCVTMAEILKNGGYRTFMSGKWHLGESRPHWPADRGFDRYFGLISGSANYFDITKTDFPGVPRQMALDGRPFHPPKEGFYMTDAIADRAVGFLGEAQRSPDPFFLYLAFTAPHYPIQAPSGDIARIRGRYRDGWDVLRARRYERMRRLGIVGPAAPLSPRDPDAQPWTEAGDADLDDLRMSIYAAQVEVMDRGVGRVLEKLREIGRDDDTIILFLADHGADATHDEDLARRDLRLNRPPFLGGPESYAGYGLPWANMSAAPWRKFKTSLWEGGISVPMIAVCPGTAPAAGGLRHEVAHQIDILPTILELTGASHPRRFRGRDVRPLEGESFVGLLNGQGRRPRAPIFWEFEGRRAVRQDRWKLVADDRGPWALYDMATDRSELRDLSAEQPERVRAMADRHAAWAARCGVRPWTEMAPLLRNL